MIRTLACIVMLITLSGCIGDSSSGATRTPVDRTFFGPTAMRLHPVFTQVRDWNGDGQPDGIEAIIELQDQFSDSTKASGRILFELYGYRPYNPDARGQRLVAPWEGRLDSMEDQRARWNRVNRAYVFQLAWDDIKPDENYVLTATFELSGGGRFFDKVVIEGAKKTTTPTPPPSILPKPEIVPSTQETSAPTTAHTPPPRADQP